MPTYTAKQKASMAKLKAANKANPQSAQNQVKLAQSSGDKYGIAKAVSSSTPKADLQSIPQTDVRAPGEAFNPMQDLQRSQLAAAKAGLPAGGFNPVSVPSVFPADMLGLSQEPLTMPTTPTVDDAALFGDSITNGLQTSDDIFKQRLDALNKQFEPIQKEQDQIAKNIQNIIGKEKNSQTTYDNSFQNELNRMGDPNAQRELADLNVQIAQRTADYNSRIAALPGQGRGISAGLVQGQTDREKRMAMVELGNLATLKLAYQENIQAARDVALQTVNFMYKDEERSLQGQLTLLQINEDKFTRKEKQLADERTMILQDRQAAIEQEKSELLAIKNLAIDAVKNGAPSNIAQQMAKSTSLSQALSLGGSYLQDNKLTEVSPGNTVIDENGNVVYTAPGADGSSLDVPNLLAYAQQYAATGQIPTGLPKGTFGQVSEAAKEIPKQTGTLVNSITGIKDSKLGAAEQEDITRLFNITENVKKLAELDKQRIGGVVAGTLGKVLGSDAQSEYLTKRQAIVDDIQRMQSGAALSETEQKFYADYLPGRFSESFFLGQDSEKKIQNFANEMNSKLQNALKTNNLSIYGYSTVKVGDKDYKVGDIIEANGQKGVVLPDGNISTQSFNAEGQTSLKGTVQKLAMIPDNTKGGECGHLVNQLTGLGLGDSYASKIAKMDPNIKKPEPGMVFTMPYSWTGHTGFILDTYTNDKGVEVALVKDSNYFNKSAPKKVRTHEIPVSKMTGFKRVNLS